MNFEAIDTRIDQDEDEANVLVGYLFWNPFIKCLHDIAVHFHRVPENDFYGNYFGWVCYVLLLSHPHSQRSAFSKAT